MFHLVATRFRERVGSTTQKKSKKSNPAKPETQDPAYDVNSKYTHRRCSTKPVAVGNFNMARAVVRSSALRNSVVTRAQGQLLRSLNRWARDSNDHRRAGQVFCRCSPTTHVDRAGV